MNLVPTALTVLGCATASGILAIPLRTAGLRSATPGAPAPGRTRPDTTTPTPGLPAWGAAGACATGSAALAARITATDAVWVPTLLAWLVFLQAGVVLAAIDVAARRLPTRVITVTATICVIPIGIAAGIERSPHLLVGAVAAAGGLGGAYLLIALAAPGQIGMGDVRLATLAGLLLGTRGPSAVIYGAGLPYLLALPFALARLRHHGDGHLPFGPFLVAGTLLAGALVP